MKKSTKYLILMLLSFILLIISILSSAILIDIEEKSKVLTANSLESTQHLAE